jgi:hypothetical protein
VLSVRYRTKAELYCIAGPSRGRGSGPSRRTRLWRRIGRLINPVSPDALFRAEHGRGLRVLDLDPECTPAGPVGFFAMLRNDTLKAHFAGLLKQARPYLSSLVLVEKNAVTSSFQQFAKPQLADVQRLAPHVHAVIRQKVEGV